MAAKKQMRAFIVISFLPKKKEMPAFRQKGALMVGGVQCRARRRLMINNGNQPTNQPTNQQTNQPNKKQKKG